MTTGHANSLIIGMSGPMEMKSEIDLNQLNVFIGANGVGKSLIMKLTWCLNMMSQLVVLKQPLTEGAQFILDKSIPEHNMFGMLGIRFDSGAKLTITVFEGKVQDVSHEGFEKIDKPSKCVYMSADTRLFSSIKRYLDIRKIVGQEKMLEHYKLYDCMYIESLISRMPITLDNFSKHLLTSVEIDGLESVDFDGDFIGVFKDDRKSLSTLSSGQQALINMTLGAFK